MIPKTLSKLKDNTNLQLVCNYLTWINAQPPLLWITMNTGAHLVLPIEAIIGDRILWVQKIQITLHGEKEEILWQSVINFQD